MKQFHDRQQPENDDIDFSSLRPTVYDVRTRTLVRESDLETKSTPLQKYQLSPEIASSILQSKMDAEQQDGKLPKSDRLAGLRVMAKSADSYQLAEKAVNLGKRQLYYRPGTTTAYSLEKHPKKTQKSPLYF